MPNFIWKHAKLQTWQVGNKWLPLVHLTNCIFEVEYPKIYQAPFSLYLPQKTHFHYIYHHQIDRFRDIKMETQPEMFPSFIR